MIQISKSLLLTKFKIHVAALILRQSFISVEDDHRVCLRHPKCNTATDPFTAISSFKPSFAILIHGFSHWSVIFQSQKPTVPLEEGRP